MSESETVYTPTDVVTRIIDTALNYDNTDDGEGLCPDCCRTLAEEVIEALETEGFTIVRGSRAEE